MNTLALDLSLTASGWACTSGASGVLVPPKPVSRGIPRIQWARRAVLDLVDGIDLVVIEGYAFGVQGQQGHISLGELGGVIRVSLADRNIPFVEVPPACVKLFATGKGNAKKDDVFAAAIRRLGYAGNDHNEADALWLLAMAAANANGGGKNEAERRALAKIEWPR